MNLDKQISEFSDLLIKNGFDGMVRILDRENYVQTIGKIKDALKEFKLNDDAINFSISTYIKRQDEDNYIECNLFGKYNNDNGFVVNLLDVQGMSGGFTRNLQINISQNQDIPSTTDIKNRIDPGIKLKQNPHKRRLRF